MSDSGESAELTPGGASPPTSGAELSEQLRPAILSVLVLALLTGCAFSLLLFAIAQPLFPRQADGTLVTRGGFSNANGAHPYANPTPLANFLEMLAIAVSPASLMIRFRHMTGRPAAGWLLPMVMVALFMIGLAVCDRTEMAPPPAK